MSTDHAGRLGAFSGLGLMLARAGLSDRIKSTTGTEPEDSFSLGLSLLLVFFGFFLFVHGILTYTKMRKAVMLARQSTPV